MLGDKPAINAMLTEIAGKQVGYIHLTETAKVQKDRYPALPRRHRRPQEG